MSDDDRDHDRAYADLQLLAHSPALFNAVVAGLELGVLDHVAAHPGCTSAEIAAATGLGAHQARVLLLALCSLRLLERRDGGYRTTRVTDEQLSADRTDSWRHVFLSRHRTDYHGLGHAGEALRTGTNAGLAVHPGEGDTLYSRLAGDPDVQAALYASIIAFTERTAPALIGHPELTRTRHLLDVGGGSGEMAKRFAAGRPDAEATLVDSASVVAMATHDIPAALRGRVHTHAADILTDPLPPVADTVLLCHVLEVLSPEEIATVLASASAALPSGGRVLVYAFTAPDDEGGGLLAAQLSFYLTVLATGRGMAYPASDHASWLTAAGFDVRVHAGLPYEHSLVVGTKP